MNHQIEIKYGQLRGLITILNRIRTECRLPVIKALHLKRFLRTINAEAEVYNTQYNEIVEKYVKKDDKGERIIQPSPTGDQIQLTDGHAFAKEMQELFEQTFEVDSRDVDLTLNDLGSMQVTAEEVEFLDFLEEEPTEPVEMSDKVIPMIPTKETPPEIID